MIEDRIVDEFFEGLNSLDASDAFLPRAISRVRRCWSPDDALHLSRLFSRLQAAFDYQASQQAGTRGAAEQDTELIKWLCLEAICEIDRFPKEIPSCIRACLCDPDYSLKAKAMRYVARASGVDDAVRDCIKSISRDSKASIGNRLLALWVLWKLRKHGRNWTKFRDSSGDCPK